MNTLIIAGELSGDNYGAKLSKALKHIDNSATIWAIGGPGLKKEADHFLEDTIGTHSVELSEQFRHKANFKQVLEKIKACLKSNIIHRVVIIDYPQKNFKIAEVVSGYNVPITTFITPNFWVWGDMKSAKKLAAYSHSIITIFKKEYELYKDLNPNTYFFGHPLLSELKHFLKYERTTPPKIAIFPGSRFNEISRVLPPTLTALKQLQDSGHHFELVIIAAHKKFNAHIQSLCKSFPDDIPIITKENMSKPLPISFAITASGSITLELLIQKIPMLILGKVSWLTYIIVEHILGIKIPLIGLPNILAEQKVVPELRQTHVNPAKIQGILQHYLYESSPDILLRFYDTIFDQLKHSSSTFNESAKVIYNENIS